MMKNDLSRQSLMPFHEDYLFYDLTIWYERSRLVGNMQ